jgi:hypothetical protein
MSSTLTVIKETMQYIYDNREMLGKDKFSDVHFVPKVGYRVHKHAFIPKVIDNRNTAEEIGQVVDICFPNKMVWDAMSNWITIKE